MFKAGKIAASLATGAMLINAFSPAVLAASTTIEISGNGSSSDNDATVNNRQNTVVTQSNEAWINNNIVSGSSSGGNEANDNTGGDVLILSGDARSDVDVMTKVNLNRADLSHCGDCMSDVHTLISGNGSNSDNDATTNTSTTNSIFQNNSANINNNIDAWAKTGRNDANRNTGGDTTILTGTARAEVDVVNMANANIAKVGGETNGSSTSTITAQVTGNGSQSGSEINLDVNRDSLVVQSNNAEINNDLRTRAITGHNRANDNTGGELLISSGDADSDISVDNRANFNAVSTDCGCLLDTDALISSNGSDSDNTIAVNINQTRSAFQDNAASIRNEVHTKAKTGRNEANRNTGSDGNSSFDVVSGNEEDSAEVSNSSNVNLQGVGLLELPGGLVLDLRFDLGNLFGGSL